MNVEELLTKKNLEYRVSGGDFVVHCLNPEHDDSNPSMRIDQILGVFNCLSCGYRGNIFTLFEEKSDKLAILREKLFRKITEVRAASVGLEIPKDAVPYIGGWRDISPKTYKKFNAFKSHQPEFLGRIVFPIRDITGRIILFQGRDETGSLPKKYYNHPRHVKLPLFPKVKGIQGKVILVEGIFDMLNLHDKGLTNAVCIFGVNSFTKEKASNLIMQGVDGVDIILDGDDAGSKGAEAVKEVAEELMLKTRTVNLPEGTDPGGLSKDEVKRLKKQLYG